MANTDGSEDLANQERFASSLTDLRIADQVRGLDDGTDPFVAAVRATRMPMIITDPRQPDNPVVFTNDAFCRLSGYERHEILGRNCRFLQCPETDPETVRRIREAVAAVKPIEADIRNRRKNGDRFWNRLLLAPVYDSAGRLAYFFASQVDVTLERERLLGLETNNAALMAELTDRLRFQQEREREMALAMRAGRFGTWSIKLPDLQLTTSETCKELFGRPAHAPFPYEDRMGAILPEDRILAEAAMARALAGDGYDSTHRIQRPDGSVRWLASRGQAFTGVDGKPVRISGVAFDVTAEHRADRMRGALVELSNVFRHKDDPDEISFAVAELLGRTLDVSRAGYGLIDEAAETIVISREWSAPDAPTLQGTYQLRDFGPYFGSLRRGETMVVSDARQDPHIHDAAHALEAVAARAMVNVPLMEQRGLVAILYLSHDKAREWPEDELSFIREVAARTRETTERRRAEQALACLAASLETEVQQRTQELMLAEEQLRQSQKMEAVGQLTGGLAHDFNNLLTAIGGSLELLQARVTQGRLTDLDRFVNAAQGAVRRAAALTHRLLAFSRRQTLAPKPTDVTRLITGMEDLIRRTAGPAVTLEVVTTTGLWTALVDPPQLENALLNLCINARDAMPDGGRIMVETANKWLDDRQAKERDLPPGQYLSLSVTDTGTGMSPELITHIFDPFFTTKPLGQGTGLGLSMIYGFARQSNGQIRVYSEPGQGTTMTLYLPRYMGDGSVLPEAEDTVEAPSAVRGESVLVVDDEPVVRMLAAEVLLDLGYTAIEASDGASGLKVLQSDTRIDLLLTDVGLPGGMNGRQLADAARALRPTLKVLFITGYAENAVLSHRHLDPGMQVLTKPFAITTLADRISKLLAS